MRPLPTILALATAWPLFGAAQTIYRCTDSNGRAVFQQAPCKAAPGAAIELPAGNVVEGNPAGEAETRRAAARSAEIRSAIARGEVLEGMSADELRQVLGEPRTINTDQAAGSVQKQYVYQWPNGDARYVYLRDDTVVGVQDRPARRSRATQPCHSEREIENARTTASSVTQTAEQRRQAEQRLRDMQACKR